MTLEAFRNYGLSREEAREIEAVVDQILAVEATELAEDRSGPKGTRLSPQDLPPGDRPARYIQVDLLRTLLTERIGATGVETFERQIGKPISEMTRSEAEEMIDLFLGRISGVS